MNDAESSRLLVKQFWFTGDQLWQNYAGISS